MKKPTNSTKRAKTPKPLTAVVEEIDDEDEREWNDWTPRENRILVRFARVDGAFGRVTLTEAERCDPSVVHMFVYIKNPVGRALDTELDVTVTAADLDSLIDALTLARDTAIVNWMLEPASRGSGMVVGNAPMPKENAA